ncbi:hypothetical protein UA08_02023 [Talaromyces atroroseus]|uniref:Glyoxalase/fosfomycin resistance/dioxygenase domain-containing protein n=1 Tax=Talaromyces atroroseus TaxID=1441469 RepID=A0A1Q5QAU7_TALAT|nr:hypothetical protein UA08_02023 [Talaromyces atroroseus]OKL63055.1 hypothetical protein UA08_02023 [Talaromyces atroroseus]
MPLSHLTLTVSHLPTSTSFFLSCLQPLGYKFIGRHDEYIGFGSKADEPADFWLAQEQPGTPAGAAHIAFPAPSTEAVNSFFISALKAGGKIHGEPKVRDPESGYFSAAVVDLDGNSIEAVYRPPGQTNNGNNGYDIVSMRGGPSALQTGSVKNGSVVSRARSTKTESVMQQDRAVHAIENIPASRVQMLYDQQQSQQSMYQSYTTQTQSDNTGNSNGSNLSAKTIIGTLLGATAGAAIAYAMIKGDSSASTSAPTTPTSQPSAPNPMPMPAQSQYIQQQPLPPPQQQQQPQNGMSMSLPMLMPLLGPAPGSAPASFQEQQPVYRALEAPPAAARSTFTANDAISAFTRSSSSSKNKSPRADTIYEDTEYYPSIEGGPQVLNGSVYSQEPTTMTGSGSNSGNGIRRTANGSVYATRELPIRAIEYTSGMSVTSQSQSQTSQKSRSKSYPCDPSTFISSYAEPQPQGHIIGDAESEFSSISTIKPAKSLASSAQRSSTSSSRSEKKYHHTSSNHSSTSSSHRSIKSSSKSHHSSHHHTSSHHSRYPDDEVEEPAATVVYSAAPSSRMSAHKIALPDSKPGSTYSAQHSTLSKRSSRYSPHEIPLPESAAPSTVFLDAVDADADTMITPDDSISQVGVNTSNENRSSSGRSHRSRSGPSSTASSKREKESKFDMPIKPSDSISQVSSNIHAKSRVSERSDRTVKAGSKVHSLKSGSRH